MTWALATIGFLLLAYAALSGRLESRNISAAVFFTASGLLAGPVFGVLDLSAGSHEVKLLAEVTLTLVLFADATRISLRALRAEYAVPLRLLGIGLPLTMEAVEAAAHRVRGPGRDAGPVRRVETTPASKL
jgi:sodium/hydrogen antiporter